MQSYVDWALCLIILSTWSTCWALEYSGRCTFNFPVETELHTVKDTGVTGTEEEQRTQNLTLHSVFETMNQECGRPVLLICDPISISRVLSSYCSEGLMLPPQAPKSSLGHHLPLPLSENMASSCLSILGYIGQSWRVSHLLWGRSKVCIGYNTKSGES